MRPPTIATIPTIHLDGRDEEFKTVQKLRETCLDHGLFYLNGHGMEELFPKIFAQSKKLFSLPLDEKKRLNDPQTSRGYRYLEEETLDPQNQHNRGDTKEGFHIGYHYPPEHPLYSPAKLRGPNVLPTKENCSLPDCEEFQKVTEEYYEKASTAALKVVQLLLSAIGLEDKHALDSSFAEHFGIFKLLHYAAIKSEPENGIFGCGAHSDYGMLTLLLTDENSGLQIQTKTGEWLDVPPQKGSLIVFVGDMLERWTNGLFRSTVHRVLTNGDKERYSVPFFFDPDFDCVVKCFPTCCSKDNPPKYPPTKSGQYLKDKFNQTHADFQPEEA
jgi:isopenicillin N synthase-like dioxygenase